MIQKSIDEQQVMYNQRWVDKSSFRAYVYNENEQKLANSYEEYELLLASGLWFPDKSKIEQPQKSQRVRKPKDDTIS